MRQEIGRASFVGHGCPAMSFWVMEGEESHRSIAPAEILPHPLPLPPATPKDADRTPVRRRRRGFTFIRRAPGATPPVESVCWFPLTPSLPGAPPPISEGGITVARNGADKVQLRLGSNQEPKERTSSRGRRPFTGYLPPVI